MIYLLFSFAIGLGGGTFQVKGDNIVSPSYGPKVEIYSLFEFIPNLMYSIDIKGGRANASTRSLTYEYVEQGDSTILIPISSVLGNEFEFIQGALSLYWYPLSTRIKPYILTRLGLMRWRFKDDGEVVVSLNGNNFDRYSLTLGGGIGVSSEFSNFVFSLGVYSDFIFSVDKDWEKGFGTEDENEYTLGFEIRIAKEF